MLVAELAAIVRQKVLDEHWESEITDDQIERWVAKLERCLAHSTATDFQLAEILHYLRPSQIADLVVPAQSEEDYLIGLYQKQVSTQQPLKTPEETFGEQNVIPPCPKCTARETTFFAIQKRSADEPTSYFYQCGVSTCGFFWKSR